MPLFETLAAGPLAPSQIFLHARAPGPALAPDIQRRIDFRWPEYEEQARRLGHSLFNGPAAQLAGFRLESSPPQLHLEIASTDYKTFLVTTLRDHAWFQAHAPHAITPALGNSILLTYRDQILLGIRSPKVAAYAGHAHLIGGVFDRLLPPGTSSDATPLVEHLYLELREELNLSPDELLHPPRALGLFRDTFLAQPEIIWHGQLAIDPALLIKRHSDDEHAALWVGSRAQLLANPTHPLTPLAAEACRLSEVSRS